MLQTLCVLCQHKVKALQSKRDVVAIELVPHNPAWVEQYKAEAEKLLQALGGWAWKGGEVFLLEHVGSTSIPDIVAKPCIDIVIGVHPFPLERPFIHALESLGYEYKGENGIVGRQYFRRGPHDYHVHVYEAGSEAITHYTVFRDYLRANKHARVRYEKLKRELVQTADSRAAYTEGKTSLVKQLLQEAHAWHVQKTGFEPVEFVAKELSDVAVPWCVASGWGLDLFLDKPTRFHDDFDVCIWRTDQQPFLKHLQARGWRLHVPVEGKYRPWQRGEFLDLPVVQIHARRADAPFIFLDVLLMESDNANWLYRREPKVTMPKEQVMRKARDLFILNPILTLLFKSRTANKDPRAKDQKDFENVLPLLTREQKDWLDDAFARWLLEHPWRARLKT
jgi:GrpB-like predicted nucleotidyltransferase (UPF0157 family)